MRRSTLTTIGSEASKTVGQIGGIAAETCSVRMAAISAAIRAAPKSSRAVNHVGETRRQWQADERFALGGNVPGLVDRLQVPQKVHGFGPGRLGRRIEKGEAGRIVDADGSEVERQLRKVGFQDFRRRIRLESRRLPLTPQTPADARFGTAGATAPLIGRETRVVSRRVRPMSGSYFGTRARPAVDHQAHAVDGQRRLGNGRRQDRFPLRRLARPNGKSCSALVSAP